MQSAKCLVFWAVFVLAFGGGAKAEDGWRWGRATFYGIWWSLHHGSCGYGNLDYWKGTGWDVAAIPDAHYEYHWSCGKCYEVKCEPMNFKDNYGNHLDRSHVCYDPNRVVTVTIVDSCPCNYPSNAYSNKRWCCGDMDHFDLSYHTFDKLASRRWGVIGLKYRPVQCPGDFRLENRHHLGRKLMEEGKGPQMYVINERYEVPESNRTDSGNSSVKTLPINIASLASFESERQDLLFGGGAARNRSEAGSSVEAHVIEPGTVSAFENWTFENTTSQNTAFVMEEEDLVFGGNGTSESNSSRHSGVTWSPGVVPFGPVSLRDVVLAERDLRAGGGSRRSEINSSESATEIDIQDLDPVSLRANGSEQQDPLLGGMLGLPIIASSVSNQALEPGSLFDLAVEERDLLVGGDSSQLDVSSTQTDVQAMELVTLTAVGLDEQDLLFGGSSAQPEPTLSVLDVQGTDIESVDEIRVEERGLFFKANDTQEDDEARIGVETNYHFVAVKESNPESEIKLGRVQTGEVEDETEKAHLPPFSLRLARRSASVSSLA